MLQLALLNITLRMGLLILRLVTSDVRRVRRRRTLTRLTLPLAVQCVVYAWDTQLGRVLSIIVLGTICLRLVKIFIECLSTRRALRPLILLTRLAS